jgi:hypothetical protein
MVALPAEQTPGRTPRYARNALGGRREEPAEKRALDLR